MVSESIEVCRVLRFFTPFDILSHRKCRVGSVADGGYVLFDDFTNSGAVYSFGIGGNVDFDEALATLGKSIYMFDHTIAELPKHHDNFYFYSRGLSSFDDEDARTFSLGHYISQLGHQDSHDMILKIDVEGAEWDVLSKADPAVLGHFRQIVLEVHTLLRLSEPEFRSTAEAALKKLTDQFILGHVHANNYGRVGLIEGLVAAETLELTYIRRDIATHRDSTEVFPQSMDFPNDPARPDIPLWFYPFLPGCRLVPEQDYYSSLLNCSEPELKKEVWSLDRQIATAEAELRGLRARRSQIPLL